MTRLGLRALLLLFMTGLMFYTIVHYNWFALVLAAAAFGVLALNDIYAIVQERAKPLNDHPTS